MSRRILRVAVNLPLPGPFHYYDLPDNDGSDPFGKRVTVPFSGRKLTGFVTGSSDKRPDDLPAGVKLKTIHRYQDKLPVFDRQTLELANWISSYYFCSGGQALSTLIPSGKRNVAVTGLQYPEEDTSLRELNEEQQAALERINLAQQEDSGRILLLHGVTGSGKTEVYRHAARRAVESGKQVIILVPEIALTPQTLGRFEAVFPDRMAVLHSRLTPAQRLTEWRRVMNGTARVVVGARSAVFAPAPDLGLIIIDEEHEQSYKAGDCPRYHARQVAFYRMLDKGTVLLGSATPTLETLHHARNGKIELLKLTGRISPHPAPRISIINLEETEPGVLISQPLLKAIAAVKANGEQGLLFLNRRGFAPSLICRTCREPISCPHCSIPLTFHRADGKLLCHYCNYSLHFTGLCPTCGNRRIKTAGAGTERVEQFLSNRFPGLKTARIDSDTTARKGRLEELLLSFGRGEIDLLIGTQMITKGLDFPNVTLVGVLAADNQLTFPDFRAFERTFNQLIQVTGRCGRGSKAGHALIQTNLPDEDPIASVQNNDADGFYERELERRRAADYPPFSRMVRLTVRSSDRNAAEETINRHAAQLLPLLQEKVTLLGPAACPLERINRNYRFQLLLSAPRLHLITSALRTAGLHEGSERNVYLEIDIDPLSML